MGWAHWDYADGFGFVRRVGRIGIPDEMIIYALLEGGAGSPRLKPNPALPVTSWGAGSRRGPFVFGFAPHPVDDGDQCHPDAQADRIHGEVAEIGMPSRRPRLKRLEQAGHGDARQRQH